MKNTLRLMNCPGAGHRLLHSRWKGMMVLILFFLQVVPGQGHGSPAEIKLSLTMESVPLKQVLREIERQSGLHFFYSTSEINTNRSVTIRLKGNLNEILTSVFRETGVSWQISKKQIVLKNEIPPAKSSAYSSVPSQLPAGIVMGKDAPPASGTMPAEATAEISVKGRVSDEKGNVLPGVTILVKGTKQGTTTDENGSFIIAIPDQRAVLVFSFVGYISTETEVGGQTSFDIILKTDEKSLDEVVVVGYGVQKKTSVTAAVSTMKGDKISNLPTTNLSNNLGGRMAGVIVKQGSGEPGRDGSSIFIRGISTTGSTSPLLIVDGIPRSFQQLDPNSIESFTVLKDAAAVAPYGVAGANGVVLVTTKKGRAGKPTLTYNGYLGFQNPTVLPEYLSAHQFATLKNIIAETDGLPKPYSDEALRKYQDGSDPDGYPSENILDVIVNKNAQLAYHNLEISGGSDKISYYAGLGYQSQQGMWANSDSKRFNLAVNVDANVTNSTTLSIKLNGQLQNFQRPPTDQPSISTSRIIETIGYAHIGNTYGGPARFSNGMYGYHLMANLYGSGYQKENVTNIYSQLNLEQKLPFVPGLALKGTIAYDPGFGAVKTWSTPVRVGTINRSVTPYVISEAVIGATKPSLSEQWNRRYQMTYQAGFDYTRSFGPNALSVVGVFEAKDNFQASLDASRRNYSIFVDEISLGSSSTADMTTGGTSTDARQMGLVYRVAYERSDKYLIEASGRYDGHYFFAPARRFGFFPAFSAGWRLSEEKFIKDNLRWVNNLKLRASYGEVGALAGSGFQYLSTYGVSGPGYKLGGTALQIVSERAEPNPNITWERARKTDIGLEFSIFNGMINMEADYFFEKRSNMLVAPDVVTPLEYGIGLSQVNAGIMQNKGFEFTTDLNYTVKKDFQVRLGLNMTYAKNKLIQTFENTVTYNNPNRRRTGRPLGTQFGYNALGFFQTADFDEAGNLNPGIATQPWGVVKPGDIRYQDVDGNGKIDVNDEVAIGDPNQSPRLIYGIAPQIRYKQWSLDLLFQGAGKTNLYYVNDMIWAFFNGMNAYVENLDYWRPDNTNARHPRLTGSPTTNNTQMSSFWMRNASYLRLKNATLNYNVPAPVLEKLKMQQARIYVSAQNLATWTKMVYWDPESTFRSYPQQKVVSVGISVSF